MKKSTSKRKPRGPIAPPADDDFPEEEKSAEPEERTRADDHPSPRPNNREFTNHWKEFLPDVVARDNFKIGHLRQLEILCDMYTEYKKLRKVIREKGMTYETTGRFGHQIKTRPEVDLVARLRAEIRNYSKALGLLLVRDKMGRPPQGSDKWE